MRIRSLLFAALLTGIAGCDATSADLAPGAFTATVRGSLSDDLDGQASYEVQAETDAPFDPFRYPASVTLREPGSDDDVTIGFNARPEVGRYTLARYAEGRLAILAVSADVSPATGVTPYVSTDGTLTVTESSDGEIAGTFEADLECCRNTFANTPARTARTSGAFRATRDAPR